MKGKLSNHHVYWNLWDLGYPVATHLSDNFWHHMQFTVLLFVEESLIWLTFQYSSSFTILVPRVRKWALEFPLCLDMLLSLKRNLLVFKSCFKHFWELIHKNKDITLFYKRNNIKFISLHIYIFPVCCWLLSLL